MTCLHATEPASVYLSAVARADAIARRHRPGALRRPHAWSSSSPCAAPCSPSRVTCCRRCGGVPRIAWPQQLRTRLAKEVEANGIAKRRRRLARPGCTTTVLRTLAEDGPSTTAELRERDPAAGAAPGAGARARPTAATSRSPPRARARSAPRAQILRGANEGDWRTLAAALDADRGLAGGAGRARTTPEAGYLELVRRWLRTLRSRHRGRPRLVARRDQGRRTPGAGRARRRRGGPVATASATCCPTTSTTSPSRSRGPRCCRCSTRPRWAGSSATSTSTPTTGPTCSTPTATAAPPPGGAAGSSAAGCRTPTVSWWSCRGGDVGAEALAALQVEAERLTAWLGGAKVSTVYASLQMKSAMLP